ncbi:hypothetical protein NL676_029904 [Syzygium grande]|nr:hypothetical protein NL676_029904 [Syzygium grande]
MPNPSPVPKVEPLPIAKTLQAANGSDANNSAATHLPVNEAERPLGHRPILKGNTSQNRLRLLPLLLVLIDNSPANGHHSRIPHSAPVQEDDGWTQVPSRKGKAPAGKPQSAPNSVPMQSHPGSTSAANLIITDHPPADLHPTLCNTRPRDSTEAFHY